MKALIIIDMQNDFITGVLGTSEAQAIVPKACEIIENFDDQIYATIDLHQKETKSIEGQMYASHCLESEDFSLMQGARFDANIANSLNGRWKQVHIIEKSTFAQTLWWNILGYEPEELHLIGVCTDICVLSNALVLRSTFPHTHIYMHASACAGTTPEHHKMALEMMRMNCIEVIDD